MFVVLITLLQGVAACFTIFGFLHTPNVVDTVVTYGASGPDAPNMAMYFNSFGTIAIGVSSYLLSLVLKSKFGMTGALYAAVINVLKSPNDRLVQFQLFMAVIDMIEAKLTSLGDPNDVAAIEYMRKFISDKFVQQSLVKPSLPAH